MLVIHDAYLYHRSQACIVTILFPNDFGGTFLNLFVGLVFAYVGAELGVFITNRVHYKKQILFALSGGIVGFFLPFLTNPNATFSVGPSMFTALILAAFSIVPRKPLLNAIKYGGSLGAVGGLIWGLVIGSEYLDASLTLFSKALIGAIIWSLVIITLFLFYWIMNMYTAIEDDDKDGQEQHTSISE